jgi:GGDEF domain-containing protein
VTLLTASVPATSEGDNRSGLIVGKHHTGVWVSATDCRRVDIGDADARAVIEHLVDTADAAMYEAKRAGGHQACQAGAISQQIDRLTS